MIRTLFQSVGRRAPAPALTEGEWREVLALADRTQLTLHLRGAPGLPAWLAREIEVRYGKNAERRRRLRTAYAEAAAALTAEGIEFVLLKGFTHEAGFGGADLGIDGSLRVQYDLDILTQPADLPRAREVFKRLGYAPHGTRSLSDEHERPLVRPSEWSWRGDFYDPEMPVPIELHSSAWSRERDRIRSAGMEQFWSRRCPVRVNGLEIPAFAHVDRLAFAALHVLRHILRNDARPAHVLELARFLEHCNPLPEVWDAWRKLHPPELQALQAISFRFAKEWFGCALPALPTQPRSINDWFREFAWSPLGPNKDVIWLHMALLENRRDRIRVFLDRMLPLRWPHEGFLERFRYHAAALVPALGSGVRWRRRDAVSTAAEISDWKRRSV